MEFLVGFWLMLCHWVKFDTDTDEQNIDDTIEILSKVQLPYKVRTRRNKEGQTEYVLYVKDADRDYARYATGWR